MAEFTWTFDAPTGTFKNHSISAKVRNTAIAQTVFTAHAGTEPGYGKGRGESHTIVRIAAITEPSSGQLTENNPVPEDTFSMSTQAITVVEWGRQVPWTNLAQLLSSVDLPGQVEGRLREQMMLTMDTACATAFKAGQVYAVPTAEATLSITTNGSASGAAAANLNLYHIERIRDYLYDDLRLQPDASGEYRAIFRTLGLRGIKDDPSWEEWHKYTSPDSKRNSEVGKIESIRFQETNHSQALAKVGTGSVLGEGVVFGEDAVVMIEAQPIELRAFKTDPAGLRFAVMWYGVLQFGQVFSDTGNAGQARVMRVTSS